MSVLKSKRKETTFKVITHFMEMRKLVTYLIYRQFTYKPKATDTDAGFKEWVIKMEQEKVLKLLQEADRYITMANSIFPAYSHEYEQRRELQNCALGLCFDILQEFQYIIETLSLDIANFERYVTAITEEIRLIRGWRQSDNLKRKALAKREQEQL